jgi:hypothetical protein
MTGMDAIDLPSDLVDLSFLLMSSSESVSQDKGGDSWSDFHSAWLAQAPH